MKNMSTWIELCDQAIQARAASIDQYLMYIKKAKAFNKLHRYEEALISAESAIAIYPKKKKLT